MAGAGAALALGTQAGATNPGAVGFLSKRLDIDLALFSPDRQFTVAGNPSGYPGTFGLAPGTVTSGSKSFLMPAIGWSTPAGKNGVFAVLAFGNGGMNTNYAAPVFSFQPTGINLMQMFIAPTYAHKLGGGKHALGVSAIAAYQRFEAKGLRAFSAFSSDPANLTDNKAASSVGAGVRVGYQGQLAPALSIGVSYQSPIFMGKFKSYAGLFAEQGGFNIPQNLTAGLALKATSKLTLALDVRWVDYSSVASVGNPLMPNIATSQLGRDDGAGFEWQNVTTVKGGLQYEAGSGLVFRGGYSYNKQPIPSEAVIINILAPGVIEQHVTAGFSKTIGAKQTLHLAVTRALPKAVTGPNPLEAPGQQSIELKMSQWDVSLGYTFGF
jgi:long-chain fatty acid transport protein